MNIIFKQWNCTLVSAYYHGGSKAIKLVGAKGSHCEGEPIATATVFLEEHTPGLDSDVVFIKDYSENKGMAEALFKAGIIKGYSITGVASHFVTIMAYQLTPEANALWEE